MGESDAAKIQKHLNLLKKEYVKLQNKTLELEQKLNLTAAATGEVNENSFISQLMHITNELHERETLSDVNVIYGGKTIRAHKLILVARSDCWCSGELNETKDIELEGCSVDVGNVLMKWVYTDKADIRNEEAFIMDLVRMANRYKLKGLRSRCESLLISSVSVSNCIRFYQTAEDIGAESLKKYCTEIIANHWDDLETKDFEGISAHLLYDMFKAKSAFPIHFAIRHHREDVVFLYLIEYNLQLPGKLNEVEPQTGCTPIQIALSERQESIATTLVQHGCDITAADSSDGKTLLHKAIEVGDEYAATFLIENSADLRATTTDINETVLHLAAVYKPFLASDKVATRENMSKVVELLLLHDVNVNAPDVEGRTAMHGAISAENDEVFSVLLSDERVDLERKDNNGHTVLWYALLLNNDDDESNFASRLVKQGSSTDAVDPSTGDSMLHKAAQSKIENAGLFLIDHGAQVSHTNKKGESPLHSAAQNGLSTLVDKLLKSGSDPNTQTLETEVLKTRAAARKIEFDKNCEESRKRIVNLEKSKAMKRVKEIKESEPVEEKKKNTQNVVKENYDNPFMSGENGFDEPAVDGSNPFADEMEEDELNPFLDEDSTFFNELQTASTATFALTGVTSYNNPLKHTDDKTRTDSDITLFNGKIDITAIKSQSQVDKFDFDKMNISLLDIEDGLHQNMVSDCWNRTPLHMAVTENFPDVVNCFIHQADNASRGAICGRIPVATDFNLIDSEGQSPLWLALLIQQFDMAMQLIEAGANVNSTNPSGDESLLHKALMLKDLDICLFLVENGADVSIRNKEKMTPLEMAIHLQLLSVIGVLCKRGANANDADKSGNTVLFRALKSKQMDVALTLVNNGADTTGWHDGINGCSWTLLHHAINDSDEDAACFLIKHGSDVNSPRKPDFDHRGGSEVYDGLTPLHLACEYGLDKIAQCLVENGGDINAQDSEGRSPIHIAIRTRNPIITHILLSHPDMNFGIKDHLGQTPFVVAMACRDNEASASILAREPSAAEQFDNKGRNYLHIAITNSDVDSVLFLISIEVNVNSRIQDGTHRTPLHLAMPTGNEIIVRHLLLAGADVNATDKNRQNPLHVAAIEDKSPIISILLQNRADPDLVDSNLNNALHLACQYGNMAAVKTLLTESNVNAEAYNVKGQNPLHVLAVYSRENAAAIFEIFRQTMPNYPLDAMDVDENTAIFLAYTNGAVGLCCALLKAGARIGTMNKHNVSIFNAPVATKKLLFKLLDLLNAEPSWSEGPNCHACGQKFNVANRKHHCRHCGRLLCSKCSQLQMPILKYELSKPVRVCQVCFECLTNDTT